MARQRSLPSDLTGTEVLSKKSATAPKDEDGGAVAEEDSKSVTSVVSDVLPEGQDEQAGCVLS